MGKAIGIAQQHMHRAFWVRAAHLRQKRLGDQGHEAQEYCMLKHAHETQDII